MSGEITKVLNHSLIAADGGITSAQQEISVENSAQPIVVSPADLTVIQPEVKPVNGTLFCSKRNISGSVDIIQSPSYY